MTNLILCEKPSQAMDISKALGIENKYDGYIEISNKVLEKDTLITWAVGHLISLADPVEYDEKYSSFEEYPMLFEKEEFKYVVNEKTRKQFNVIKRIIEKSNIDTVIIATDPAREGENIAYKILNKIGINDIEIKRLWLQSRDNKSIIKAFNNLLPSEKTYPLYIEARTRELADWLVGMNLTRHYTRISKAYDNNDVIHIGRVSTPTLNLVYEKEKSIKDFKKSKYKQIQAIINKDNHTLKILNDNKFKDENELLEYFSKNNISSQAVTGIVKDISNEEKYTQPPKFFNLSSLQSYMNQKHRFSAKETLNLAQSLYEKKLISYPRTDSEYITVNEYEDLKNNIDIVSNYLNINNLNNDITNTSLINPSKVDDHYAILITDNNSNTQKLSEKEETLYKEVVTNIAMNFMNKEKYLETNVLITVNGIEFKTKGKTIQEKGYTELIDKDTENVLPQFTKDEELEITLDILDKETQPPKRLTEQTLLKVMGNPKAILDDEELTDIIKETKGLGTPATRADIIENLKDRKYIQVQKNKIYMTKKGIFLCELVKDTILSKADMTGQWESYLKEIGQNNKDDDTFLENTKQMILKLINQPIEFDEELNTLSEQKKESENVTKCPSCQKGYIVKKKSFYGCTEYKNGCEFTLPSTLLDKKLSEMVIKDLCDNHKTNKIKGFVSKKGKNFEARLLLVDNELKFDFN